MGKATGWRRHRACLAKHLALADRVKGIARVGRGCDHEPGMRRRTWARIRMLSVGDLTEPGLRYCLISYRFGETISEKEVCLSEQARLAKELLSAEHEPAQVFKCGSNFATGKQSIAVIRKQISYQ